MKLNLGCGKDIRKGYVNVDLHNDVGVDKQCDLSKFPWPWPDGSAEEIMMLDFLEHFPYRDTDEFIVECWRVLKPYGKLVIQVPDAEHLGKVLQCSKDNPYVCNKCGNLCWNYDCNRCGQTYEQIAEAAVARMFGGQDYVGNWHYTSFNKPLLQHKLEKNGFDKVEFEELNENGETYYQNWNIKAVAEKKDLW